MPAVCQVWVAYQVPAVHQVWAAYRVPAAYRVQAVYQVRAAYQAQVELKPMGARLDWAAAPRTVLVGPWEVADRRSTR